jgi:hypothetical protein
MLENNRLFQHPASHHEGDPMNTTMRNLILCALLVLVATGIGLAAQENQAETGLAKVDVASRSITNSLVQTLRTLPRQNEKYRLQLGSFTLDGERAALGALWANNLATFLAGAAAAPGANIILTLQEDPRPDFVVEGELVLAGDTIRVYTRLVRLGDSTVLKGVWSDLAMDPVLAGMLLPSIPDDGTPRDRYEPDSLDSPLATDPGAAPLARTLHSGDEDWFIIQPTARGILVAQTTGDMDTLITLHTHGSPSYELQEDDDSGDGDNARIEYPVSPGQAMILKVSGYDGATGSYSFSAALEPLPAQTTRNDTRERAQRLALDGEPLRLVLEQPGDTDWFSVAVPASGGVLQLRTTGGLDMFLELYDNQGTMLAEDDDSGEDGNAMLSKILQPGQYYIKLSEYDGNPGVYRLQAKLVSAGPADQYEPDDTMESARPIRIGSPQRRNFNHPGDIDWAVLDISRAGTYGFSARPPQDDGLDTYIELFDAAGQLLQEDDDGGESLDSYLEVELGAGRYYLKVWQVDGEIAGDGNYTLTVRVP